MDKNPFIGQMDKKIQIIKSVLTQNLTGEQKPTDVVICEPFAHLKELNGSEDVEGKVRHLISRTYTIRYNPEVLKKSNELILIDRGTRYNVYHVKEMGRKKHLEIYVNDYE